MLTAAQHQSWENDGFLVLEGFVDVAACNELVARAEELVVDFDPTESTTIFSTNEQTRVADDYFLDSGDKVRFFFEEEAFDDQGRLRQAKERSINKIGHALHDLDPAFEGFSRTPELAELATALGLAEPRLLQSMYIFKQPHIGGEVGSHQDATFLYTDPVTVTGFWFALQDAAVDNGCLWALAGGHRLGLEKRFARAAGGGTRFETYGKALPEEGLVPLEAATGTLVVLHGLLPHRSGPNRSDRSRHAYSLHVIEAGAQYPADNWLQRSPTMPARGFQPR